MIPQSAPACVATTKGAKGTSVVGRLMGPLNRNFREPRGALGRLAGWIMARENVRANRLVVEAMGIGVEDRVLEIGCGPGVALVDAAGRADRGFVAGVDPSEVMVAQARHRCRAPIAAGRVEVRCAPAAALPYADETFTRAFSVNALSHWPSAQEGFAELRRVLRPEARLVIALRKQRLGGGIDPHAHGATEEGVAALRTMLEELGFRGVESQEYELGRETLVTILASAPQSPEGQHVGQKAPAMWKG